MEFKSKRIPFSVSSTGITNRMYIKDNPLAGGENQLAIYKRGWRVELENTKKINPAGVLRDNHGTT